MRLKRKLKQKVELSPAVKGRRPPRTSAWLEIAAASGRLVVRHMTVGTGWSDRTHLLKKVIEKR